MIVLPVECTAHHQSRLMFPHSSTMLVVHNADILGFIIQSLYQEQLFVYPLTQWLCVLLVEVSTELYWILRALIPLHLVDQLGSPRNLCIVLHLCLLVISPYSIRSRQYENTYKMCARMCIQMLQASIQCNKFTLFVSYERVMTEM